MNKQNEIEENKKLIKKYPWLWPVDWNFNPIPEAEYDYSWTQLDDMPEGWKAAFGKKMCEDIQGVLVKHNCVDLFRVVQVKEKFGSLRFYFEGLPMPCHNEVHEIVMKYEEISSRTCCICGKKAEYISSGWICPYCGDCARDKKINISHKIINHQKGQ